MPVDTQVPVRSIEDHGRAQLDRCQSRPLAAVAFRGRVHGAAENSSPTGIACSGTGPRRLDPPMASDPHDSASVAQKRVEKRPYNGELRFPGRTLYLRPCAQTAPIQERPPECVSSPSFPPTTSWSRFP